MEKRELPSSRPDTRGICGGFRSWILGKSTHRSQDTEPLPQTSNLSLVPNFDTSYAETIAFVPALKYVRVIKVYDGDTITVAAFMNNSPSVKYRFSIRIRNIDSPEMRTKNEGEKKIAIMAQVELSKYLLGNVVELRNVAYEKYGRILAEVYHADGTSVGEWMIFKRLAVSYDGRKKLTSDDWLAFYENKMDRG